MAEVGSIGSSVNTTAPVVGRAAGRETLPTISLARTKILNWREKYEPRRVLK